jgi:putative membrane protein
MRCQTCDSCPNRGPVLAPGDDRSTLRWRDTEGARGRYDRRMTFLGRLLVAWAIDAVSLAVAAWIFAGITVGGSAGTLILAALVYGVLATLVKPVLKLLTLPLAVVTLGIAWFFVAMFILWLTDLIVGGFEINGFWDLVGGTIVVWAVGAVADLVLFPRKDRRRSE